MSKPTIVVVNGSADEGFWTVYYLLKTKCFNVRATVRRMTGDRAERLRELKVGGGRCEVVQAATEDEPALRAAFRNATGIYGTTIYNIHARRYRPDNPEELAQGRSLLAAARATPTLRHFVFQTMMRFCTPPAEIGLEAPIHFRTKWQLEEELKAAELPWTLVRQPAYMRQLRFGVSRGRKIVYPYANDYPLAFVAEEDIGKVVARIFMERESFLQQVVKVVSDIVTPAELAARAHACLPFISPRYRKASALENAIFDQVIVRLKPAYRYVSQINANMIAGNRMDVDRADLDFAADLINPLALTRIEAWLMREFAPASALRSQARPGINSGRSIVVGSADEAPARRDRAA